MSRRDFFKNIKSLTALNLLTGILLLLFVLAVQIDISLLTDVFSVWGARSHRKRRWCCVPVNPRSGCRSIWPEVQQQDSVQDPKPNTSPHQPLHSRKTPHLTPQRRARRSSLRKRFLVFIRGIILTAAPIEQKTTSITAKVHCKTANDLMTSLIQTCFDLYSVIARDLLH